LLITNFKKNYYSKNTNINYNNFKNFIPYHYIIDNDLKTCWTSSNFVQKNQFIGLDLFKNINNFLKITIYFKKSNSFQFQNYLNIFTSKNYILWEKTEFKLKFLINTKVSFIIFKKNFRYIKFNFIKNLNLKLSICEIKYKLF
jgi:hypothetical protein